jgi:hypothetical protein
MSDRNTQLMKAMGSKSGRYDPEPPDQWRWYLKHGTLDDRFMACMKAHTIALGHGSPYATDEHGNSIYIEHFAIELGWSLITTREVVYRLHEQGRIRLERKAKKIWLCAEVAPQKPAENGDHGRTEGERFIAVQTETVRRLFANSPYLIDSIMQLPEDKRASLIEEYETVERRAKGAIADAVAAVRAVIDPIEDSIFQRYGIEKKRLPQRREPITGVVQLSLLKELTEFVRDGIPPTLYAGENGVCTVEKKVGTNGASLFTSDTDSDKAGGQAISVIEHQKTDSVPNGKPARPPAENSGSEEENDPLLQMLVGCGFSHLEAIELQPVREALGKTDLQLYEGIVRDRLTRGRIGLPVLTELAKKAQRTARRIGSRAAPRPPGGEYESAPAPDDDSVVSTEHCKTCGGLITTYRSGEVSHCACAIRGAYVGGAS